MLLIPVDLWELEASLVYIKSSKTVRTTSQRLSQKQKRERKGGEKVGRTGKGRRSERARARERGGEREGERGRKGGRGKELKISSCCV